MEKVTFGDDLPGYVCGDPTHPGVVVVQEWWGVTETIQAHALRKKATACWSPTCTRARSG